MVISHSCSRYFYARSYGQIESLQVAGELTLSQAIVSSQIPPHLINRRNTLHCNYIYYFLIKSATVHVKVKLLTRHGKI